MICKSPKHTIQHKSPLFSCMRIKTSPRRTFLTCYVAQPYPFQLCWPPLSTWRWFFLLSPAPVFSRPVYLSALLLSVAISCYLPNAPHPHSLQLPGKKIRWRCGLKPDNSRWSPFLFYKKLRTFLGGCLFSKLRRRNLTLENCFFQISFFRIYMLWF